MDEEEIDSEASKLPGLFRRGKGPSLLPGRKSFIPGTSTVQQQQEPVPPDLLPSKQATAPKKTFAIGDRVCISGVKTGIVLYFGKILLAEGIWCGIELEETLGKHDGQVEGIRYFTCPPGHGIFAPVNKVSLAPKKSAAPPPDGNQASQTHNSVANLEEKTRKPFQSKLQRRVLPQPRTFTRSAKEVPTASERGSQESLSSKSDNGSDQLSQKTSSDVESDVAPPASQIKKPKLSFLRKPKSIPKSGKLPSAVGSTCTSAANETRVIPNSSQARAIQKPGLFVSGIRPVGSALNKTAVLSEGEDLLSRHDQTQVILTVELSNQTRVLDTTQGIDSTGEIQILNNTVELLNQTQVIHSALNKTVELSNEIDSAGDQGNHVQVQTTESEEVNQTPIFDRTHDLDNQKRSQPEDKPETEPLSKRQKCSHPPSQLDTDAGKKLAHLNSTFDSAPSHARKLPSVPGKPEKVSDRVDVLPETEDAEDSEQEAFSPEIHRQLVAGGRQYLNLTFDSESVESQEVCLPEDLYKIVTSPSSSEENCDGGEDVSELDSSLWFLKGDRHISEYTRLGILKPEELNNTDLLASRLWLYDSDGPNLSGLDPALNAEEHIHQIKTDKKRETLDSIDSHEEVSSLGILKSLDYNIGDGSNFLLDNPRVLELRLRDKEGSSRLKSASPLSDGDVHKTVSRQQDRERLPSDNFDIDAGAITSTPMAAKPSLVLEGTKSNSPSPVVLDEDNCVNKAHTGEGVLEEVRKNLAVDFKKDCNDGPSQSVAQPEACLVEGEVVITGKGSPTLPDENMDMDVSNETVPAEEANQVDHSPPIPQVMQASVVMPELPQPEPKPMTDSGISLMTASQEIKPSVNQMIMASSVSADGLGGLSDLDRLTAEQNQLAADLIAGHRKMDRPLSLISSVSSADTGYVPDTDSEHGTLTTNSPSEWLERAGGSPVLPLEGDKNLAELYAQTFHDYQKGVMRYMARGAGLESDSDLYSDTGTLAAHSEKEQSDMEETKMETDFMSAGPNVCQDGENSETESSNDVTEIMMGNPSCKHQHSNGDGSTATLSSDDKSREHSLGPGEYPCSRDTTPGIENDQSTADGSICRTEQELDPDLDGMEGDQCVDKNTRESVNSLKISEKGNSEKQSSARKIKGETSKPSKKQKTPELPKYKKPNVNVGSKLAEYLKAPTPTKPREEGKENADKAKKNQTNRKRTDSGKDSLREKRNSDGKMDEKGEAGENKATFKRDKVVKELPKILKRTTPKSKWGNIMSQIESHKDGPPKPREKPPVKSNLETTFSQPVVAKLDLKKAEPSKVPAKKRLPSIPKPDYSRVKSRLNTGSPTPKAAAALSSSSSSRIPSSSGGSGVVLHLDLSESMNDCVLESLHGSERSSRSDLSFGHNVLDPAAPPGTTKRRSLAKVANRSVVMRPERPGSTGSTHSDDVVKTAVKTINDKNTHKSPRRKSEIKSSIPPIAPRKPSPAKSPRRPSEASTSKASPAVRSSPKSASSSPSKRSTPTHQNRNKSVKSKTPTNVTETDQPKNLKTTQEISRLESLCEARTKELTYLKMQLKSGTTAFDAMSALVNYLTQQLDAFSCPVIKKKLELAQQQLSEAQCQLVEYEERKKHLEDEIVSLNKQHEATLTLLNTEHSGQLLAAKKLLQQEHENNLQKVDDQHKQELDNLRKYHERHFKEVGIDHDEDVNVLKQSHLEEIRSLRSKHDNQMEELHKQHSDKLEKITHTFESIKKSLSEKVDGLCGECDELRNRARLSEEALHRDTDVKVQMALAPFRDLPQEIESLKLVIEMRNEENRELRRQKLQLERDMEELPTVKEKCAYLKQQVENLEAIVNMKSDHEKQLNDKCHHLMKKYNQENKTNKRLSMNIEELVWKMTESGSEFGSSDSLVAKRQLSHSPTGLDQSWNSSGGSETSLSPIVMSSGPDTVVRRAKRLSASYIQEGSNGMSGHSHGKSTGRSLSESIVSAPCESLYVEYDDLLDGEQSLSAPVEASSPEVIVIDSPSPPRNGTGMDGV